MKKDVLNSVDVKDIWDYFCKKYNVTLVKKENSKLMSIVGWAFSRLGIMSKEKFIEDFYTSLLVGKKRLVYLPKGTVIGEGDTDELCSQLCTLAHELYHLVVQKLGVTYLFSKYKVIKAETDAYLCNLELYHYFTNSILSAEYMAGLLASYNCGTEEMSFALKKYSAANKMIRRGHYKQPIVLELIEHVESL